MPWDFSNACSSTYLDNCKSYWEANFCINACHSWNVTIVCPLESVDCSTPVLIIESLRKF